MAFGGFSNDQAQQPVAEINMIPLIDVMLVLLVIFIIAAPLLTHAVKIDLPRAESNVVPPESNRIQLALDAQGRVYWDGEEVTRNEWQARMSQAAGAVPQPDLLIRADGELAYRNVVQVMADAARAGLARIGFVTDPRETP